MNKTTVLVILLIWIALALFSVSRDSILIDEVAGAGSVVLGVILLVFPSTHGKGRYKSLGLIIVISGILMACISLFRKVIP